MEFLDEDLPVLKIGRQASVQPVESLLGDGLVDLAPPDVAGGRGFLDDEAVARRPARLLAGQRRQRAAPGHLRFAVTHGVFIERRNAQGPVDGPALPRPERVPPAYQSILFFR